MAVTKEQDGDVAQAAGARHVDVNASSLHIQLYPNGLYLSSQTHSWYTLGLPVL